MAIDKWMEGILEHRAEMRPVETDSESKLKQVSGIKAVIFDVYGTLVISGSGDVGSADATGRSALIRNAIEDLGITQGIDAVPTAEMLQQTIQQLNFERQGPDCPNPEVDIVEVWRHLLAKCGWTGGAANIQSIVRLATQYEAWANPTWPMRHASQLLTELKAAGLPLGIVSNAQIFTPSLVKDLLNQDGLEESGFSLDLCVFSNRYRQAKPGPRLFDVLLKGLLARNILPREAIYVGNDMLNDIWAASQAGLRTAWFAGDRRSCRPRQQDDRCQVLHPDVVLTDLMQLPECLQIS